MIDTVSYLRRVTRQQVGAVVLSLSFMVEGIVWCSNNLLPIAYLHTCWKVQNNSIYFPRHIIMIVKQ